ncbi:MAG: acetaldehyde dehydrogenase (acetylating) [Bacillota bacterium]
MNLNGRISVAIIGPGNIGTDLMYKVLRSKNLKLDLVAGVIEASEGLALARKEGVLTTSKGIGPILENPEIKIVFDTTGAKPHIMHAPMLEAAGKIAIDLTPAAVGPYVVPAVNMEDHLNSPNINLITCGGQATIPIVYAINEVAGVEYAEIVATISSKSAGPATRQNIDEFTKTTAAGLVKIGGAQRGKAIIILNPADPPILMRNTIYTLVRESDADRIRKAVNNMVARIQEYVPGYRLKVPPLVEGNKVTTMIEVKGAGDYLPEYSGNLDIITAAAVGVAEKLAANILKQSGGEVVA